MKTGLFIGRFQPFHNGHLQDIRNALKEVDELIIAIGSSQHFNTKENPFSVEERIEMIENTLAKENIGNCTLFPVPDIGEDAKWVEHVKTLVPKFDIVYTGNDLTEKLFRKAGYKVKRVNIVEGINGTSIRDKMLNNEGWEELVPLETIKIIEKAGGVKRVKRIFKKG